MQSSLRCLTAIVLIHLLSMLHAAEKTPGVWEVLEGCKLVEWGGNDGDSFLVEHGGEQYVFRLYFVDALETYDTYLDRIQDQARYFQIERDQVLSSGRAAALFAKRFLSDEFTVITRWVDARGSSDKLRYYALIQNENGEYLSDALVKNGLARIYGAPTEDTWPGGFQPSTQLRRLNTSERDAQRSIQGIWAISNNPSLHLPASSDPEISDSALPAPPVPVVAISDRININTASSAELQTLPGIGPSLAARIIAARPIASVAQLSQISGISDQGALDLAPLVKTEEPPPPAKSAALYRAEAEKYINQKVAVLVKSVAISTQQAPDGFRAVLLDTGAAGTAGGTITAFIPDAFYDTFLEYYKNPGREFTGLFYRKDDETVLVYPRQ